MHAHGLQIDPEADTHALVQASLAQAPCPCCAPRAPAPWASAVDAPGQGPAAGAAAAARLKLQGDTFRGLDRAGRAMPSCSALGSSAQAVQGQIQQSLQMVERDILNATELQLPSKRLLLTRSPAPSRR